MEYVFVYGTLRRQGGVAHDKMRDCGEFVDEADYQGKLFHVSWFPGAVPSPDPRDQVRGELYRLRLSGAEGLAELDLYEACDMEHPEESLYLREKASVTLSGGESVQAWIYLYNRSVEGLRLIPSGDFADEKTPQA
jgi:gamma-glutamylcyclotransferase (GGCT)/AIG2-like uncharacterized protein YtfP